MRLKHIELPKEITPELSELVGIHFGDGCINLHRRCYTISYTFNRTKDALFAEHFLKLYRDLFAVNFVKSEDYDNILTYRFRSILISKFFNEKFNAPIGRKHDLIIPDVIKNNDELLISFLRGLFDTDGCFCYKRDNTHNRNYVYLDVKISMKSFSFAKSVCESLIELGLRARINKKVDTKNKTGYDVVLSGIKQCGMWMKIIGSNNPRNSDKYSDFIKNKNGVARI